MSQFCRTVHSRNEHVENVTVDAREPRTFQNSRRRRQSLRHRGQQRHHRAGFGRNARLGPGQMGKNAQNVFG